MDFKKTISRLVISLVLSPVVYYIVLWIAKLAGASYDITHGEAFIIWLLMAIVINLSITNKSK
jgi:hypothetical protein